MSLVAEDADGGDGEAVCVACGRSFDSEAALRAHVHDVGIVR